jgi:sterol desaturase/sphingolipid hydroxylase (fatty acid hydroxylase superfamily)
MDTLNWLINIDPNYILAGLIVIFYSLETILHTPFKYQKRHRHLLHNLLFQLPFFIANYAWAFFLVFAVGYLNKNQVGLFHYIDMPYWVKLILGVAMFDMVTYWFHRMAHKVPLLWRLHRVHHSDTKMDSTTFFRSHPLEIVVFGISNILAAGIFGMDFTALGLYYFIFLFVAYLEHANFVFPQWVDKTLGLIFVSPNFHKVHHEQDQYYTDSNFADLFIIWDRLFGTFKYRPVKEIKYGLKEFDDDKKQTFLYLMKSPFINIDRIHSDELANIKKTEMENKTD